MHVNKVSHVKSINLVAKDLGEDEDGLFDVAMEMEPEDGVIWVYGIGDEALWRSPTSGSKILLNSSKSIKTLTPCSSGRAPQNRRPAAYAGCIRSGRAKAGRSA
jgi:hypothetical protein